MWICLDNASVRYTLFGMARRLKTKAGQLNIRCGRRLVSVINQLLDKFTRDTGMKTSAAQLIHRAVFDLAKREGLVKEA